ALAVIASACGDDPTPGTGLEPGETGPAPAAFVPPGPGRWSSVMEWPHIAIHMTVLPDGQVLTWGGGEPTARDHRTTATTWNPANGRHTPAPVLNIDIFCSGHAVMPDGRVFIAGGHIADSIGIPDTRIFDPATNR